RDLLYSFHVPVFFFISALLFTRSMMNKPLRPLLRKRTVQLLYPYFIWSLLQTGVEAATGAIPGSSAAEFLRILYWPRAHFWFLPTLLGFMWITAGFFRIPRAGNKWIPALSLFCLGLYLCSWIVDLTPFHDLAKNSIYFAAGVASAALPERLQTRHFRTVTLAAYMVPFVLLSAIWIPRGGAENIFGQALLAFTGILATLSLSVVWPRLRLPDPSLLGRKSLVIYVAHILTAYAVMDLLSRVGLGWGWLLLLGTLSGIGLPLLLEGVCGRLKFPWLFSPPQSWN
ncbi:MAG: acyltransferase family protein, partial [Kiritimatiellia bacterium]